MTLGDLRHAHRPTHRKSNGRSHRPGGLPPHDLTVSCFQYEVLKPLPESVTQGPAAPAFGQAGGGTQYYFDKPIQWYIDHDYLGGPDARTTEVEPQ